MQQDTTTTGKRRAVASLGLAAVAAGMVLGAGVAAADTIQGGSTQTRGGDIHCTVKYTNAKDAGYGYKLTAKLTNCNKPLRDGMRLKIGDDGPFNWMYLDERARIEGNTAVFEDRDYGYLGADEYFYVDKWER